MRLRLDAAEPMGEPFDYHSDVKLDGTSFSSWSELFGPVTRTCGNYTNLFEENINTGLAAVHISTGTGTLPFTVENIVLLTNGYCASACAVLMKNLAGVRSIAVGGRPQKGPTQYVGGTKGKQIFSSWVMPSAPPKPSPAQRQRQRIALTTLAWKRTL